MPKSIASSKNSIGTWRPGKSDPKTTVADIKEAIKDLREPLFFVEVDGKTAVGTGGEAVLGAADGEGCPVLAYAPAGGPETLGDASFKKDHGLKYAYVGGAMANGIASVETVEAMAKAGMLGFFGAAGLAPNVVEDSIDRIQASLGELPYGFNLIHSPHEPGIEAGVAGLYIRKGVHLVSASAFLGLTSHIVRYRMHGIHRGPDGRIVTPNQVIAKVSRVEIATHFFSPPPVDILQGLVAARHITTEQAELASHIPVAQDISAESDSGGHTDNRPMPTLLPTLIALRDRLQAKFQYDKPLRVGSGGGIGTPAAAAAAFSMGAAYILIGSIHQACREAGTSDIVRDMLAQADMADVGMAAAADMFEMGVKVQVLKRGTMFAMRAAKLYEIYRTYEGIDAIPTADRERLEKQFFRAPLEEIWAGTRAFFEKRDPSQNVRADKDPKHKMALIFRWYLGFASRWANAGEPSRKIDYQVWCGPAMGAFNEWAKGSYLERRENRLITDVARNILYGAALQARLNILRGQGVVLPADAMTVRPVEPAALEEYFR